MKLLYGLLVLLCATGYSTPKYNQNDPYYFDGSITRPVLENYLSRAVTMSEFLTVDPFCNDGTYPCKDKDILFIKNTGAKFIGRSIYRWGSEEVLNNPEFWKNAKNIIEKVHKNDPDVIFQAGAFEAVYKNVKTIKIPEWTFRALGMQVEERNFSYANMLNPNGKFINLWGVGGSVPDITQVETQLWFMYLIGSYINIGVEAVHLGQVSLIGMNDPQWKTWSSFMKKARNYANKKARRHFVMFDAHTPGGGMVINGISLLDFNSFPLRIKEVPEKPMECILEKGHIDALYGRSKGCKTPSGWSCESLPYLVEFDNFGISDHPGVAIINDHYVWGYDEISWFYIQNKEYKDKWLRYAYNWLKENDQNAFLEMPGARVVTRGNGQPGIMCRAIAPSKECPYGMDIEQTIKDIWVLK